MFAFVNDTFVEEPRAAIGITDLGLLRGYGIFDFFRSRNFIPLFIDNYLARFEVSAYALRLKISYSNQQIKDIIKELNRRNDIGDAGIRLLLTGGYSEDGYNIGEPNFIITQKAVVLPSEEQFHSGLKIITYNHQRELPSVKSVNYLTGIYLLNILEEKGADEVLYIHENRVLEFPRANVFLVLRDGTIVTPDKDVLWGITRQKVIELAEKKYKVVQRVVQKDELFSAAEIFLTSTTRRIMPVTTIDGIVVGDGRAGKTTMSLYHDFMELENSWIS